MKKLLLVLLIFVVLGILGLLLYYNFYKHAYEDKTYKFMLLDTRGWGVLDPKEGVYMSLGTYKNNKIISYFGISPVLKSVNKNKDRQSMENLCRDVLKEQNPKNYSFSEVKINELSGYTCQAEVVGLNINETLHLSEFILFGNDSNQYDYILIASFPLNNSKEKEKVETLLNNFWTK